MYPAAELNDLAARKAVVRARVSVDRLRCATYAADAARPLQLLDRVITQWKRIPPFAKIAVLPLGLLLRQAVLPGKKVHLAGRVMRLLPVAMSAIKILKARRR